MPISIPLTQGKVALIDEDDFDLIWDHGPWHARQDNGAWYARAHTHKADGTPTTISMHRLIMGFPALEVDHKDRNGLNNTKINFQLGSRAE
jgi:hypothetical protein